MNQPTAFDCEETAKRLADYLDRELSDEEILLVEAHIAICAICAQEYRFEAAVLKTLKDRANAAPIPRALRDAVLSIIDEARRG